MNRASGMPRRFWWMFRLVSLFLTTALLITFATPVWSLSQTEDDLWDAPLNLSHSGIAFNPAMVIDSDGTVHVVWQDDIANYLYSELEDDQWSTPEITNLNRLFRIPGVNEPRDPLQLANYTGPNPLFIAGSDQIFAFWISPDGIVFTSKVQNQSFGDVAAWDSARSVARGAASFAAAVDASGESHLAFLRLAENDPANPPGIYYTRTTQNGTSWANPVLLYESAYLLRLGEGEANLSLATAGMGETQRVYVAWDNRPRKQVFVAQSADGGISWEQPTLVAGPTPGSGSAGPFNIRVGTDQTSVVLLWQTGSPGACSQYYQSSGDFGVTWTDPQPMMEDRTGCAQSNQFVTGLVTDQQGPLYLLTRIQNQVFLSAWGGSQWSQPQVQTVLSGFEEPEIFTQVILGCHQASLSGDLMYVVGCDLGGGGDVWITSRDLGSSTSFFSPAVWGQPSPVANANSQVEAIEVIATRDDLIHVFFSQRQDPVVYYSYWNGKVWSRTTPAMELPEGETGWPAVAASPSNELYLVVRNNRGTIYFSRAISGEASAKSSWSVPVRIEGEHEGKVGSVDIAWDAETIFVAYSVPVNEGRGIYLVHSKDKGSTWSKPVQVFNGEASGSDLVGAPSLLATEKGQLHIIWRQQSILGNGNPEPLSLHYARSEDAGTTFSDAKLIVDEPVRWQEIVSDHKGNLHLFWQPPGANATVWDQISLDGGRTWEIPQGLTDVGTTVTVIPDRMGRLHFLDTDLSSLDHWLWDGSRWQSETPFRWSLAAEQGVPIGLLSGAVNQQGQLVVVLAGSAVEGDATENVLLYSTRMLELPQTQASTQEAPTQSLSTPTGVPATPTSQPTSEALLVATSTPSNPSTIAQNPTGRQESSGAFSPLLMALLPVALLLLIVFGSVIRRIVQMQDR